MSRFPASAIGVIAVLAMSSCAPPAQAPADLAADTAAINELTSREMTAFTGNDAAALGAVFAENAVIMPPGEPAKEGLAALTAWSQALGEQYTVAGEYTSTDVIVSGDWAVQRFTGRLSMTPKAGGVAMSETIKGVHVLHRGPDGTWRITQDVWNADQPPPPPPPPAAAGSF